MADRQQLYQALRNADAAGDTAGAKTLATYIQTLGPDSAQVNPLPSENRGVLGDIGHELGLFGRMAVNSAASLPAMASDAVTGPINAGLDAVAGKGNGFRFQRAGDALNNVMTGLGIAVPENSTERVVQDIGTAAGSAASMAGAGNVIAGAGGALAQGVGDALSAGPVLQIASAATGAGASGVVREKGGGVGAQLAAGLAGSMAPSLVPAAGAAAIRGALRGGEDGRQVVADNLANFEAAGTTPTLGQATDGRFARATESLLSKTPGGAGVIAKKAQQQADEMATAVQNVSDSLAPDANATTAGDAIKKGVALFKDSFKSIQQQLYAKLDEYIPSGTPIAAEKTTAVLADLNADIEGAPAISKWFKNARIQGIEGGLQSDTTSLDAVLSRPGMQIQADQLQQTLEAQAAKATAANTERQSLGLNNLEPVLTPDQIQGQVTDFLAQQVDARIPYESLKKLRSLVGVELSNPSLVPDVPIAKWKALYGALSDDLGVAAKSAGPEAETAWNRANLYTQRSMGKLEQLKGIVAKDTPEKVFAAATAGTAEGATNITRVMNALPMDSRREVVAALLQKMGRATNGQQNALGDAFSPETFLTNLSKMSPEARASVFGRTDVEGLEDKIGQLAKVAESRRVGGKIFANPSGTAASELQIANAGALVSTLTAALLGHSVLPFAGAVAIPALANAAARAVTSPTVVRFAAGSTGLAPGTAAAAVEAAGRVDPRLTPMSKRQVSPRIELRGMAQPEPTGIDAIGSATNVDEAIQAARATLDPRLVPMSVRRSQAMDAERAKMEPMRSMSQ